MISRSRENYPLGEPRRAETVERENREQDREPKSGEVESQCSGGLGGKSSSAE